jgi:hypothetical protein
MHHVRNLAWLTLAWVLLTAHPASAQAPAKPADTNTIATLIAQLGSENFQERQAATRSLEAIGRPALAALREAVLKNDDVELRRRAEGLVEKIENSLEQLLEDYTRFGLPLPPRDAPLVRFRDGDFGGKDDRRPYSLGFILPSTKKSEARQILDGTTSYELGEHAQVLPLDPTDPSPHEIETWAGEARGQVLILAIQCKSRGWNLLAGKIFEKSGAETAQLRPAVWLRRQAWRDWEFSLRQPKSDWRPAAKHMRVIIQSDANLNTQANQALLRSLDLALVHTTAKPGSIEARIDSLVDATSINVEFNNESTTPYTRLAELGFDAVPALIEHLGDDRLTRYHGLAVDNSDGHQYRIGHMASHLLEDLAAGELEEWSHRSELPAAQKTKARAWWERTKKVGEETHALAHVLPTGDRGPNEHLLKIVLKKYPRHLPGLYQTAFDRSPHMQSRLVALAVCYSELPRNQKMELLIQGARHEIRANRESALGVISGLDHDFFIEVTLKLLDGLPRTPKGSYWRCPEEQVVYLVLHTDDNRVWKALEKTARRVDVGLRMQLLKRAATSGDTSQRRPERLAFLRSFLDDATLRDVESDPDRFVAVPAGDGFPRLEVRNYAAMEIAELLKLERKPMPTWDDKQWAQFQDEVQQALKR